MNYAHRNGVFFEKASFLHLPFLLELKQESWWGTHKSLITNVEDQKKWFENLSSDTLVVVGTYEKQISGVVVYSDIDYISRTLNISGSVLKKYRGAASIRGFQAGVDFAFEILNMHRLNAEVLETNLASLKFQLAQGFKAEGRKRKAVYKSGKYYDSIITGILREDWEKHPRILSYNGACNLNFNMEKAQKSIENINSLQLLQSPEVHEEHVE